MTFFPASLALASEVCPSSSTTPSDSLLSEVGGRTKKGTNPVIQQVKIIMALGLIVVHLHRLFIVKEASKVSAAAPALELASELHEPTSPWDKISNLSVDQLVTVGLGILLLAKYVWYDKHVQSRKPSLLTVEEIMSSGAIVNEMSSQLMSATDPCSSPDYDAELNKKLLAHHFKTMEPSCTDTKANTTPPTGIAPPTNDDTARASFNIGNEATSSGSGTVSSGSGTVSSGSGTVSSGSGTVSSGSGTVSSGASIVSQSARTIEQCLEIFKSEVSLYIHTTQVCSVCIIKRFNPVLYLYVITVGRR